MDVYRDFLDDRIGVVMNADILGLNPGSDYTIREMSAIMETFLKEEYDEYILGEITYGFIDCGADGEPELAVCFEFDQVFDGYIIPQYEYFVIKRFGDGLRVAAHTDTYYRWESEINEYGYITYSGSGSASSFIGSRSFVNAEGEEIFLYSFEYDLGLSEPVIPEYYLYYCDLPDGYADSYGYDDNGYELDAYNFSEPDYSEGYDDEQMRGYYEEYYYVFFAPDGSGAMPSDEMMELYNANRLRIVDDGAMSGMIRDRESELGVTERIRNGGSIEWTVLEADWLPKG